MARILMIAALVFLAMTSDAQSEIYGGVGGPYTPMKFVLRDSSIIPASVDSLEYDADSSKVQLGEYKVSDRTTGISNYGDSLSTLAGK